ncbi:MAG: hypothetical protein Q9208_003477 [Pyrenodesmia sp. 3 TL-2023]
MGILQWIGDRYRSSSLHDIDFFKFGVLEIDIWDPRDGCKVDLYPVYEMTRWLSNFTKAVRNRQLSGEKGSIIPCPKIDVVLDWDTSTYWDPDREIDLGITTLLLRPLETLLHVTEAKIEVRTDLGCRRSLLSDLLLRTVQNMRLGEARSKSEGYHYEDDGKIIILSAAPADSPFNRP